MLGRPIRIGFAAAAWLFVACVVAQVFLAGLGVFRSTSDFDTHRTFALIFGWLTLVMLVLFSLQSVFVEARSSMPELAALHPVNGFVILLIGIVTAMEASKAVASQAPA